MDTFCATICRLAALVVFPIVTVKCMRILVAYIQQRNKNPRENEICSEAKRLRSMRNRKEVEKELHSLKEFQVAVKAQLSSLQPLANKTKRKD